MFERITVEIDNNVVILYVDFFKEFFHKKYNVCIRFDRFALCFIRINMLWIPHDVMCIYDTVFVHFGTYHDLFFTFGYFFTTLWIVYHDDFSVLINWKTSLIKKMKIWEMLKLHINKLTKNSISSFMNTKPNTQCT